MRVATFLVLVVTTVAFARPALSATAAAAGLAAATAPLAAQLNRSKEALASAAGAASLVLAGELTSSSGGGVGGVYAGAASKAASWATGKRAVVVFQGGGGTHAFTGPRNDPSAQCDKPRPPFVQALLAAGFPVFTAPAFTIVATSTGDETGCPPQPPLDCQWDASGWPTATGNAGLNFLGWLAATYGYRTFDLVGYSYGGIVGRAAISELKAAKAGNAGGGNNATAAPGFSYAAYAAAVKVSIPTLITMNSPHLGSPSYDIAADKAAYFAPVAASWGLQYANLSVPLISFSLFNTGSLQFVVTPGHTAEAAERGLSWDATQVGALDGVALTLLAGDFCGPDGCGGNPATSPRTDGTVALYSQLMQECGPPQCGPPPTSVFVPPGLVPPGTVRKVLPTVHSTFVTKELAKLTGQAFSDSLSVANNPEAIAFVVETVAGAWKRAGVAVAVLG